ncbi:hypothetical protein N3114_06535 [Aliarcobacter butzleri]|uniref:hypothetical protein n=1 Tax=Aliarcobacter butzleri TaxID=28197 RepID=UPI0021B40DEA|nr:hypothetical protein [Aliarcobacter butzleri]UXC28335.1 hypothetical protein N3114_06535 [Aliarcobacter butzleri]
MFSFDIGKWILKLLNTSNSYFDLLKFVNDKDAFKSHTEKRTIYSASINSEEIVKINIKDSEYKTYFIHEIKTAIEHSMENYSNQMVVILATYIETMHSEFFHSIFTKNNKLIYDYITENEHVKLNLIFDSKDKDEIIDRLINIAKKNIINGSLKKIIERIFKITKYKIDIKLIESIQKNIIDKRNLIVHESTLITINEEELHKYFNLIEKYLLELGKACKKNGAYYVDQANWLE